MKETISYDKILKINTKEFSCIPRCIMCVYRFNGCDEYLTTEDCHDGHELFKTFGLNNK